MIRRSKRLLNTNTNNNQKDKRLKREEEEEEEEEEIIDEDELIDDDDSDSDSDDTVVYVPSEDDDDDDEEEEEDNDNENEDEDKDANENVNVNENENENEENENEIKEESKDESKNVDDEEIIEEIKEKKKVKRTKKTNKVQLSKEEKKIAREINQDLQIKALHPELVSIWDELDELSLNTFKDDHDNNNNNNNNNNNSKLNQPNDIIIPLLPFQLEGLNWLVHQEQNIKFHGGILADEMGMGKTIQMISLLVTKRLKPNLIVCPTVAILQWYNEIINKTKLNTFKILIYHGFNRTKNIKDLLDYDIVLTTYSLIEIGYRRQEQGFMKNRRKSHEKSILHSIHWKRIILDEAHSIKDRNSSTAKAIFSLNRDIQWSLTGTPLQNRVGELYSLIKFLNSDPFTYYFCKKCNCKQEKWLFPNNVKHCTSCGHIYYQHFSWWNQEILKPIQNYGTTGSGLLAFTKLNKILDHIMLRRTKVQRVKELGLPPRIIRVRRDYFNPAEEELYDSLYSKSARTFSTYASNNTVLDNYASIFSLLSKMRLAVNHPFLVTTKLELQNNIAKEKNICGICLDIAEDAIKSKCHHIFCREDIKQYIECSIGNTNCPVCYKPLSIDLSQPEIKNNDNDKDKNNQNQKDKIKSIINYIDMSKWKSSTKIEALVEELKLLQNENSTSKSIVFSQFVAFLDLIHWRLSREGFNVVKLDGRMGPQQRDEVIKLFMTNPTVTVFLVSLKAGGVALNLTEASNVFIMDPWWNPAVEDQAFDRIHRLGQHRPIKITRMIIENSIESRILKLQEKKQALFESTVGKDMSALTHLSQEDLQFLFVL